MRQPTVKKPSLACDVSSFVRCQKCHRCCHLFRRTCPKPWDINFLPQPLLLSHVDARNCGTQPRSIDPNTFSISARSHKIFYAAFLAVKPTYSGLRIIS
ncbi:hypothetical protein NDI49_08545 [Trichocoleus sp. ST-U3]|uniref:hypothetical protein n=1 Tax=Coleofasciculus sp. FACHB-542 TaxID=2692787 RepID=UPI001684D0FD|nr:hypothetical protein [Coleofasciculus sp. FACHB-542]MBD2087589.1 hypothetical protein [Coleofasciculus sp. FACHB-542]